MDREQVRINAVKLVYEMDMGGAGGEETVRNLLEVTSGEAGEERMMALFSGTKAHMNELDARIAGAARGWSLSRMARVDLAILRVGAYELFYTDTPHPIVINEAVEIANRYSQEKSAAFINGILGTLSRNYQTEGAQNGQAQNH